jgi:hypothetical protein
LRSPALIAICPKTGCHAVLAFLSERYPPLEGRSPTRYSPVCHSTQGRSPFRVRLACIRHAASVDSEPGSNSHVREVCPTVRDCSRAAERTPNTRPRRSTARIALIGSCAVQKRLTMDGSTSIARRRHPLILRRVYFACTFYLVFKEPFAAEPAIVRQPLPARSAPPTVGASSVVRGTFQYYATVVRVSTAFGLAEQVFSALVLPADGISISISGRQPNFWPTAKLFLADG